MAFIFWISLLVLLQLREANMFSPHLANGSTTMKEALLSSSNKTLVGRDKHLRRSDINMTELKRTFLQTLNLNISHHICQDYKHIMAFLTCLVGDHMQTAWIASNFMIGLYASVMILVFLLSNFQRTTWNVYTWTLALAHISVLACLCLISLIDSKNYSWDVDSDFIEWFLLLAYLFLSMQCFSLHCLVAIAINWFLCFLIPNWYKGQQPDFVAPLISATLSALWPVASLLLFFPHFDIDIGTIVIVTFVIFLPILVISIQTLIIKIWHNLYKKSSYPIGCLFGAIFFFFTWTLIHLFFNLEKEFPVFSLLTFSLTFFSSTANPLFYINEQIDMLYFLGVSNCMLDGNK
ncbi:proto-oncogene Mas-like [Anolis carolinensis]|uniref:proto-oncogene Mas-like n=1 Tax=Anolis carolinensis TaxID=28377 RepID=UPI002F2B235C